MGELIVCYESCRDVFIFVCKKIGWEVVVLVGLFFVWMLVLENFISSEFVDYLLEEVSVVVVDGSGFGEFGEGYVCVGFLMDEECLEEVVMWVFKLYLFDKVI